MLVNLFFLIAVSISGTNAVVHSLKYMYTATSGIPNFPEFMIVGLLNGETIVYYDSIIKKMIPRQRWMEQFAEPNYWENETQTSKNLQPLYKENIDIAKKRFNHTGGVHIFQEMYGCEWDDNNEEKDGYRQEGYDGEDFLSLNLKDLTWISAVQQGVSTKHKWDNDKVRNERAKIYFTTECTDWLKKYLQYGRGSLERTVSPQVSLLQKDPSSPVVCHATGFYPSGVTITWQKNRQDHDEDVDLSEIVPNEDGTFQVMSTLNIKPEEWKKNEYKCVVEHKSRTTRSVLTEDEIKTNYDSLPIGIIIGVVAVVLLLVIIGVAGYFVYQKRKGFKPVSASDDGSNSSSRTDPNA